MIKAIIIDDEAHARQTIKTILRYGNNSINIVGEAENIKEAVDLIIKESPQLIFLDINLPDGDGFDILNQIQHKNHKVIFITAYHEFAIQAIKFSAFDYILKPVNPKELINTVEKAIHEEVSENYNTKLDAFISNITTPNAPNKVVLKTSDKIHVVEINQIIRCESDNAYTTFYLQNEKSIMVSKSIKHYDEMFKDQQFIRVHQSHLINPNFINYFNKQDGGFLVMSDGSNVPVSNQKRPLLLNYLDSLN